MIWWVLAAGAVAILLSHWRGPNAIWGTATLGIIVGIGIAIFKPGFDWSLVGKSFVIATYVGLAFEWLPRLARRN